jgi:tetratricopeptide (TPR) repeat protein
MNSCAKISLLLLLTWPLLGFQGDRADLYLKTADKMQARGYPDLALEYLGKAIEANPEFTRAYLSRGFLYLGRGSFELALSDFSRIIEIDPKDPANYLTRGLALSQSGARERAGEDFRKGCELGGPGACELQKDLELDRIEQPAGVK